MRFTWYWHVTVCNTTLGLNIFFSDYVKITSWFACLYLRQYKFGQKGNVNFPIIRWQQQSICCFLTQLSRKISIDYDLLLFISGFNSRYVLNTPSKNNRRFPFMLPIMPVYQTFTSCTNQSSAILTNRHHHPRSSRNFLHWFINLHKFVKVLPVL